MSKFILSLVFSLMSGIILADTKLVDYIKQVNPYVNPKFAKDLAKEVATQAKYFKLDPKISINIAMLESSFRLDAVSETGDYGLFQINVKTAADYGISLKELATLKGQVKAHMIILKHKIDVCKKRPDLLGKEWSCYHSFTDKYREIYFKRGEKLINKKD